MDGSSSRLPSSIAASPRCCCSTPTRCQCAILPKLFAWPEYLEAGAVFWPDMVDLRETNPVWAALDLPPRRTISFESGQVLVDKQRHWRALCVVGALNAEAERLYRMIYGDKDTFLLGWQMADSPFALVPHAPFIDERCLTQRDFAGAPLFQHRTNSKWSYAGKQIDVAGFVHLAACEAAVAALRHRWNGRVFHAPDRSVAARAAEQQLLQAGALLLRVLADEAVELELLPNNEIGAGRANDRQNWWCVETEGAIEFVIGDTDRVTYQLRQLDGGHWEGMRHRKPIHSVTLRPAGPAAQTDASEPGLVDELLRAAGYPHAGPDAAAELEAALRLLCRVDPGAAARLAHLSRTAPDLAPLLGRPSPTGNTATSGGR